MGMHVPGSQALHPSAAAVLHGPWSVKPSYQIWALVCQSHPTIPVVHLTRRSKANLPYLKALRALDLKGTQGIHTRAQTHFRQPGPKGIQHWSSRGPAYWKRVCSVLWMP
eukprot:196992-Pelagomonas_calceolata.AAC.1